MRQNGLELIDGFRGGETPLHTDHCRTAMGAVIMPPAPASYTCPKTVDDITIIPSAGPSTSSGSKPIW